MWLVNHSLSIIDTPGTAGTYAYQLYGEEAANRTAPGFMTGFLQVAAL
jgi:hypothetical protein